jgi:hypothetical protein
MNFSVLPIAPIFLMQFQSRKVNHLFLPPAHTSFCPLHQTKPKGRISAAFEFFLLSVDQCVGLLVQLSFMLFARTA